MKLTSLLPGYVVGAGGCVEGATVAVFWQKKGDQYLKVLLASKFFCRLFSTCFSFVSLNVHRIVG